MITGRGPLTAFRVRWRWIVACVLVGTALGAAHTALTPPTYRAMASAFFALQHGNSASDLVQGSNYAQNQVTSFARLATTPAVLQPVIDDLELDLTPRALADRVEASAPLDSVLVEVAVTAPSPGESVLLADAVVDSLSRVVEDLAPVDEAGRSAVEATTVAPAELPQRPVWPDPVLDLAAGLFAGLLVGLGAAWARQISDLRIRDADDLSGITALPVLGTVGALPRQADRRVVSADPRGVDAESFRQLRTNLAFLDIADVAPGCGARVLSSTSSVAGEGKSTVALNLALSLAATGARVLLVDADLRRPTVADVLGIEGGVGLTTVLLGQATTDDVVQEWGSSRLRVLPSGPLPPNPAELLGSPAMTALVRRLRDDYDHVVLDAPPLLPVADAAILSRIVDGTLVVVGARTVRRPQLAAALRSLDNVGARVLGVVLNGVRRSDDVYGYAPTEDRQAALGSGGSSGDRPPGAATPATDRGGRSPVPPSPQGARATPTLPRSR